MKLLRQGERKYETCHNLFFEYTHMKGAGFGFDCDASGVVDTAQLNELALENYNLCLKGDMGNGLKVKPAQYQTWEQSYWESSRWLCDCDQEIEGAGPGQDFECEHCGREYNSGGQRLAPREQWGWETGESLSDILAPGDPFDGDY